MSCDSVINKSQVNEACESLIEVKIEIADLKKQEALLKQKLKFLLQPGDWVQIENDAIFDDNYIVEYVKTHENVRINPGRLSEFAKDRYGENEAILLLNSSIEVRKSKPAIYVRKFTRPAVKVNHDEYRDDDLVTLQEYYESLSEFGDEF